jgi:glyoxylase-like metal-dependent hydrolase (beta-lactamase superfamily II)
MAALDGAKPIAIWLTHSHPDHVGALDELRHQLKLPVFAHPGEHVHDPKAERWLNHGDEVKVGIHTARVYHTPGHIGDQICFAFLDDDHILVGDTIFAGGPGKTWSAEGFQTTLKTLREVVLTWPDSCVCYPGHGPYFVLGDKRAEIEAFVTHSLPADFFGDATWDMSG